MSDYSEQIRNDLEKMIKILQKYIGGLFRGEQKHERNNIV